MPAQPTVKWLLRLPARARSREVASFLLQLDDQSRRMFESLEGCTPAELAWQPVPGQNTIGMLLAHCAIVEAFWLSLATDAGTAARADAGIRRAIGVGPFADGMPLAAGARAPRGLAGWTLARYRRLHDRARTFATRRARTFRDADLAPELRRVRPDGSVRILNVRWILYHVLEHQAGHFGQMLLLRHQWRDRRRPR